MRVLATVLGQSNEKGNCQHPNGTGCPLTSAIDGNPMRSLNTFPDPDAGRGYWYIVAENLFKSNNIWLDVQNTSVSSTSIITNWCGDAGSGVPYAYTDTDNFDPDDNFADMETALGASGHWDEKWLIISIGHGDRSIPTTLENWKQGHINSIEWALNQGVDKIFVGFTNHSTSASNPTWWAAVGSPGIGQVLSQYASNPKVLEGANLYESIGKDGACPLHDENHLNLQGTQAAGEMWAKIISNSLAGKPSVYY